MKTFFAYNWQVREDWYRWCEEVEEAELLRTRTGGVGCILETLFHVIDVEWSWVRVLEGKPAPLENFEDFKSLGKVRELDARFKPEVEAFVRDWEESMEHNLIQSKLPDGRIVTDAWGEVMRHIIAHEIHHIGQLSVWAREIGKKPVSASAIGRGLIPQKTDVR
ncbi:DinB family protein [Sporosarcina luteola]|uniref:DinB family protein n=1 Tax=Sporosarcina luteola TaxID=582850 RepID=UPI00203F6CE5|nr:DinB family protein [Sporosarcina luteola]MCM3711866.1 DinB family protein [Sporosarcina luteola]